METRNRNWKFEIETRMRFLIRVPISSFDFELRFQLLILSFYFEFCFPDLLLFRASLVLMYWLFGPVYSRLFSFGPVSQNQTGPNRQQVRTKLDRRASKTELSWSEGIVHLARNNNTSRKQNRSSKSKLETRNLNF